MFNFEHPAGYCGGPEANNFAQNSVTTSVELVGAKLQVQVPNSAELSPHFSAEFRYCRAR